MSNIEVVVDDIEHSFKKHVVSPFSSRWKQAYVARVVYFWASAWTTDQRGAIELESLLRLVFPRGPQTRARARERNSDVVDDDRNAMRWAVSVA